MRKRKDIFKENSMRQHKMINSVNTLSFSVPTATKIAKVALATKSQRMPYVIRVLCFMISEHSDVLFV